MKTFQEFCEAREVRRQNFQWNDNWKVEAGQPGSEEWYKKWIPKIMKWENVDEQEARKLARKFLDYGRRISPQAIAGVKNKRPPPPPFRVTAKDAPIYFGDSPHLCHKCGRELVPPDEDFCDKCKYGKMPNWMKAKSPPEEQNWWDEL